MFTSSLPTFSHSKPCTITTSLEKKRKGLLLNTMCLFWQFWPSFICQLRTRFTRTLCWRKCVEGCSATNKSGCCYFSLSFSMPTKQELFQTCPTVCVATPWPLITLVKVWQWLSSLCLQNKDIEQNVRHLTGRILYYTIVLSGEFCCFEMFWWNLLGKPGNFSLNLLYGSFISFPRFPAHFSVTPWECTWTCCIMPGNITCRQRGRDAHGLSLRP